MTATLHAPQGAGPQVLAQMTRDLVALAGGQRSRVRSGRGGLVVDDELALAYLSTRPGARVPALPGPAAVPGGVARLVRNAEERAGLAEPPAEGKPLPDPAPETAPAGDAPTAPPVGKAKTTAARRRRVAARPVAEEHAP